MPSSLHKSIGIAAGVVLLLLAEISIGIWDNAATLAHARPRAGVKSTLIREENPGTVKNHLVLPYAFSSESMGLTLGVGGGAKGYGQEQLMLGATGFGSFNDAVGVFVGLWNYRIPIFYAFFFKHPGG